MATTPAQQHGRRLVDSAVARIAVQAEVLAAELRDAVEGEVRFDPGSRALYATDGSNYRQVPIGVVVPRTVDDVVATIDACRRHGAPVLPRGCGTSLAGQCCNVAVVIDMSKYLRNVLAIDPERKLARVQPGTVLDDLRGQAERFHLTFGPDPATHSHCTLGGMLGNNSCGIHSVMAGMTSNNVEALDIMTYDGVRMTVGGTDEHEIDRVVAEGGRRGEIYRRLRDLRDRYADLIRRRFPDIPRRVSGYNLPELLPEHGFNVARALVGSEGTCVTILEAQLNLVDSPPARTLLVLGYPDVYSAGDHVPEVMAHGPIGCEGIDHRLVGYMKVKNLHPRDIQLLPDGRGWLLVEFGGQDKSESDGKARALMEALRKKGDPPTMHLYDDPAKEATIWEVRESGLGATAYVPGMADTWPGWEDSSVPPDRVGDYLRDLRALFRKFDYECALYGHFGQGCIHVRIDFNLETAEGIKTSRAFLDEASDLVLSYGGSLSGEHGDGQARAELLPKMFGDELMAAFREFKSIWDPDRKMNPGKIVEPYRIDQNLRLGTDYNPPRLQTHFSFAQQDHGSFAHATRRCVGVGKCRREGGGTMCPSYMVTHEEKHSTRGRARLLFEMLEGSPIEEGWKSEHVKEALDLCLACKGCKGDCPVNVDMATYKAEFLSHYYEGRPRPRYAYFFGLIMYGARLAALAPGAVNVLTQTPLLRDVAKLIVGVAPERRIPPFAPFTFRSWFRERGTRNEGRPRVILWPDTFNNHFHPHTAIDAVEVLEATGYQVVVPDAWLCCGRPLYDYGMLDHARSLLRRTMDVLRDDIRAGTMIIGLEPSCVSVFRDELLNMFPHDEDAKRLHEQVVMLSEFLIEKAEHFEPPKLKRKAIIHGHCHHTSVLGMGPELEVLDRMGLETRILDSGCCGMAGAFGFEKGEHYDVSIACAERVLLPAVRDAADDTLVIADGFSCREQIVQMTDREALHLAQVLRVALRGNGPALTGDGRGQGGIGRTALRVGLLAGGIVAAGAAARELGKRRSR